MKRRFFIGASLVSPLVSIAPAFAGDVATQALEISGAFSRATPKNAKVGIAYLTIRSLGDADRLIAYKTPACERPEMHTHITDDGGIMRMRKVEAIEVPAGGVAQLKPGGLHLMLMKLTKQLVEGNEFEVTLIFEKAGEVTVTVPVKGAGASG